MKRTIKKKKYIDNLFSKGFVLGKSLENKKLSPGFVKEKVRQITPEIIIDKNEIHNITVASTGSGKGRNSLIINLLTNSFSSVVLDVKGECDQVTVSERRRMGHADHCLNPFYLGFKRSARLNPFDLRKINPRQDVMTFSQNLADLLCEKTSEKEQVWDNSAFLLIASLICYICTALPEDEQNLKTLVKLLTHEDVVYNLAVILDTQKNKMHEWAYRGISAFVQTTEVTRSGVLFTAQNYFRALNNPQILETLQNSTIDLAEFVKGEKPMTIYLVIPPAYIHSHFSLIKIWFYTLLKALTERTEIPENPTVFYMDEIAQFGHFELLENIMTIGRGYGIKVWLYLQSFQQLQSNYPKNWRTMLENCGTLQLFGINSKIAADEISNFTGIQSQDLLELKPDEQFLIRQGKIEKAEKLDYLKDEIFVGKFELNPYFLRKQNLIEDVARV